MDRNTSRGSAIGNSNSATHGTPRLIVYVQRRSLAWAEAVLEQRLISPQRVVLLLPLLSAFSYQPRRVVQWDFVINQ